MARNPINIAPFCDKPISSDEMPKPIWKMRLRPMKSESLPDHNKKPPDINV